MSSSKTFKIDRLQRIHSNGSVIRVYQVVGASLFGWDSNRDLPTPDLQFYPSLDAARDVADARMLSAGHVCDATCYDWRSLG